MEDGSRIYDDEDITDKELIDGKLIMMAKSLGDLTGRGNRSDGKEINIYAVEK